MITIKIYKQKNNIPDKKAYNKFHLNRRLIKYPKKSYKQREIH